MAHSAPVERRGAVDVARSASLLLVVVAHLAMVVLDRGPSGDLRGTNIFQIYPGWEWLTMISPMPLFFVASGWANVGSSLSSRIDRVRVLVALALVITAVWSAITLLEYAATGDYGIFADGARIATQPLWFLTAWVPFTLGGSFLARVSRRPAASIGACTLVVAAGDIARFVGGAPRWVGFPGFFAAWAFPWILGSWWRTRHHEVGFNERRTGVVLACASLVVVVVLAVRFGYHAALIDAVPGHRSNTTPPTLFTAVASVLQVGVFMVLAPRLDAVALRHATTIRRLSALAPGLYAWHLTALAACGALLAAGLWAPQRLTWQWWIVRPVWFAAIVGLAVGLSLLTAKAITAQRKRTEPPRWLVILGTATVTVGAGMIGLYGPDTVGTALASTLLVSIGYVSLAGRFRRTSPG